SLVTFAIAGQGQAEAAQGYPTLGVELRNGDGGSLAVGSVLVPSGNPVNLHWPLIPSLRGEFASGGAGAGLGLVIVVAADKTTPDLRDLMFGLFVLAEMRVERMYGSTA